MKLTAREATLRIDVDDGEPLSRGLVVWRLRRAGFRLVSLKQKRSPSGAGWHLVATVAPRPESPLTVVALQLLLGSDPMREACNLQRALQWERMPSDVRGSWNTLYQKVGTYD